MITFYKYMVPREGTSLRPELAVPYSMGLPLMVKKTKETKIT